MGKICRRARGVSRTGVERAAKIFVYLADEAEMEISTSLFDLRRKRKGKQRISTKQQKRQVKTKKERPVTKKDVLDDLPKDMHKISWGDEIIIMLKKDDITAAQKAISLINLYLEDFKD